MCGGDSLISHLSGDEIVNKVCVHVLLIEVLESKLDVGRLKISGNLYNTWLMIYIYNIYNIYLIAIK